MLLTSPTLCSAQSINLAALNLGLFNLGSVNLQDQLAVAEGILALMNSFCLSQAIDLNSLLGLGLDDQVDMFLELAQLAQLESLGFLNVFGVQNLIESNLVLSNDQQDILNLRKHTLTPWIRRKYGAVLLTVSYSRSEARCCSNQAYVEA